jgi:hypothetical protein
VKLVQAFDHRAVRLLAEERAALLRRDAGPIRRSRGGRQRVGLWLVGVGFRIAGSRLTPRERLSSA